MDYRSLNDILQIAWPYLSKITSGLERPETFLTGNREGKEKLVIFYYNCSNPCDVSGHDSGSLKEEPLNSDDLKAWDSANSISLAF